MRPDAHSSSLPERVSSSLQSHDWQTGMHEETERLALTKRQDCSSSSAVTKMLLVNTHAHLVAETQLRPS